MLGPRRVDVNGDGEPTGLVDNPCSILDMTDLVFIGPVGTGYSRAMKGTDPSDFWTYDADIISVSKFIRLYTSLYGRWGSPKYLSGEFLRHRPGRGRGRLPGHAIRHVRERRDTDLQHQRHEHGAQ